MQAQRFGSHFLHIGLIDLISWPGCHIFIDASLDTHINMTVYFEISFVKQKHKISPGLYTQLYTDINIMRVGEQYRATDSHPIMLRLLVNLNPTQGE